MNAIANKTQTTAVKDYNLNAILSADFWLNSNNATQICIWANNILKEYQIRRHAVEENIKLKQPRI